MYYQQIVSPPHCYGDGFVHDDSSPRCKACSFKDSCRQVVIQVALNERQKEATMVMSAPFAPTAGVVRQPMQQFYTPPPPPFLNPTQWSPGAVPVPVTVAPQAPMGVPQVRAQTWAPMSVPPPQAGVFQPGRVMVPQAPVPQAPFQGYQGYQPQAMAATGNQPWMPLHFQVPQQLGWQPIGYYGWATQDPWWSTVAQMPPVWRPQQPNETFGSRFLKNVSLNILEAILQDSIFAVRQAFLPPAPREVPMPAPVIDVTPRPAAQQ